MPEPAGPSSLFAEVVEKPGALWVKLVGPSLGQREVTIITDMVVPAVDECGAAMKHLVLDVSQVTFMNSMGLGMFINFRNLANKKGCKTVLAGMNAELLSLFKMVKVDRLFTIVKDNAEAGRLVAG